MSDAKTLLPSKINQWILIIMKIFKVKIISLLFISLTISSCGGGGSDSTPNTAEGFWTGASSTGSSLALAILENGEAWGIYLFNGRIAGALNGVANGSGNSFNATGNDYNLISWSVSSGTFSGVVNQGKTINATSNKGSTISLTYDSSYNLPASIMDAAGNYLISGVSASGSYSNAPLSISSSGQIAVIGNGCNANGQLAPRSSGKNIFNINVVFTGNNCALGNGASTSGIFILDKSTIPITALALALTPNKSDGFIAAGFKQ